MACKINTISMLTGIRTERGEGRGGVGRQEGGEGMGRGGRYRDRIL